MFTYKSFSSVGVAILCLAIAGCGGGGGSGGSGDTPVSGGTEAATRFDISGTIQIPVGSVADGDVMRPAVSLTTNNNSTATAQSISNPSVTGGYVSPASGRYQNTLFSYDADPVDIYSVSLLKDQVITLAAFPAESGSSAVDLNSILKLIAADGTTVINMVSNANAKEITVPASADYFIEVQADQGPILYLLTVSQGVTAAGASAEAPENNYSLSMAHDFVPGEVLVKVKGGKVGAFSASSGLNYRQANEQAKVHLETIEGLSHAGGSAEHGMKMRIDLAVPRARMSQSSTDLQGWPEQQREKWETLTFIESLKKRDDVEWAEPNYIRTAFAVADNPLYAAQWHYPLIDVPAAWTVSTGAGSIVAVIDTGIAFGHADLASNLIAGFDFISQASIAGDGNGIDDDPEDVGNSFHGSHVAGTVAAVNNTVGGVGVAYDAKIMPLRVLGIDGSGNDADIAQAILYAAGLANDSNTTPASRADVINLSLGGPGFSNSLKSAVDAAVAQGVILVAAAGNENSSTASYPAAFANVVSVSAVGQTKERAPYSNFGSTITVAAPGGNMLQDANGDGNADGVLSTVNASFYAWFQGTSMAAPHVAGVAALMKQADRGLTGTDFNSLLASGNITDDLGAAGKDDHYGYGLINASKAMALAGSPVPTFLSINPQSISFDGIETSFPLSLSKGGTTGTVLVTEISAADNEDPADTWLSVNPNTISGDGLRTYTVNVDRTNKDVGTTFAGTITVKYKINAGAEESVAIPVLMTVPDPSKVATVGELFVGLIERSDQEEAENAINQGQENVLIDVFVLQPAQENQGTYSYTFSDVPVGDYYIFASTNMDQDGVVSDVGEAQGDYPVVGDATLIELRDADVTGLDFNVGYLNFVEGLSLEESNQRRIIRKIPASMLEGQGEKTQVIQKQN
ncbi:S8 family serine peptidase [Alkalimarinus coralli]|uniref:S8 family serine peptidase n=1 Tax=Alkalimarinus coralli TaxID=2935863 RepID=UPI00202B8B4E|nr:S8 family serine peptidase [Alkalimarinus coralli]